MTDRSHLRGMLANAGLLYAAAIWGTTFVVVKDSLEHIDPIVLVGFRFTLAAILLGIFLVAKQKPLFENFHIGAFLGFFLWALYVPQTIGLGFTTASNSAFITGLFVAFVPVFSMTIFKRRPAMKDSLAVLVSLVGLYFLTGGLLKANRGDFLTLITAMAYALHILLIARYAQKLDPYVMAFQQFLFVGVLSLLVSLVFGLPFTIGSTKTVAAVIFLAVFPTFTAFVIQMVAQQIVPPVRVSLIFAMEPVFAAVFAWTIGGEEFNGFRAIGGLLVVLAMIVSVLPSRQRSTK